MWKLREAWRKQNSWKSTKWKHQGSLKANFHTTDTVNLCNQFNATFTNQIRKLITRDNCTPSILNQYQTCVSANQHSMYLPPIEILDMKQEKFPGIDKIIIRDIRINFDSVAKIILHFLNLILESSLMPTELKTALVVLPIYKSGKMSEYTN